ncbi:OLC1v1005060C1 [Oldenlandia corymbosa var. corymbosa]|uniref:OLC1v1005060C1 n=1 Tax=Oldenlandia corymbosa var. corymbosa TaxID=529605 RepID=A0AAV1DDQ9_OLDCO|nr:OLC1v1005060C1 [Oldenlandia corymbosa var. corymbosa]
MTTFQQIIDVLTSPVSKLTTAEVVGMGIGKTTLARKVFQLCCKFRLFDRIAWVNYTSNIDQVLSCLLHCMNLPNDKIQGLTRQDKGENLRKSLKMRKYFMVFDGLWDLDSWKDILNFLPEDEVGSRILITSREMMQFPTIEGTIVSDFPHHKYFPMSILNENQSWELLEKKLFGNKSCPADMVEVGKQIARQCGGLPLAIVLIAGTLFNLPYPESYKSWLSVKDDITSIVFANPGSCLDIIGLSYNYLPPQLKACLLLMAGAFPAKCEIDVEKLSNLWRAEGFLDAVHDEPEIILKELIRRSLVSIGRKSFEGKIKTCMLHDLVQQLCLREAQKENFMHSVDGNANGNGIAQGLEKQRHLIFNIEDCDGCQILPPLPHLRSFIWLALGSDFTPGMVGLILSGFKWLRVLDIYFLPFDTFPGQILNLVNLRYLALNVRYKLDKSVSQLHKLEILLVYGPWSHNQNEGTPAIFLDLSKMRCLSHVSIWVPSILKSYKIPDSFRHLNLTAFSKVTFHSSWLLFGCSPNLKKLGVFETKEDYQTGKVLRCFSDRGFQRLNQLDSLKCSFYKGKAEARSLDLSALPATLKKLTLTGSCLSWDQMKLLAGLPNLETLKLKNEAFIGPEWVQTDEVFPRLKQLLIDNAGLMVWQTGNDDEHFPSLERLVLKYCRFRQEIPLGSGQFSSLGSIELHHCCESVEKSAREYEEYYGSPSIVCSK